MKFMFYLQGLYCMYRSLSRRFESYIRIRPQVVAICRKKSIASIGVPKCLHLRPLLFNIYINDVSQCDQYYNFLICCDNLKMYLSIEKNGILLIHANLYRLQHYFTRNFKVFTLIFLLIVSI